MWSSTRSSEPSIIFFVIFGVPSSFFSPESTSSTIAAKVDRPAFDEATAGSIQRVKLKITSSALKSSPFDHFTPWRRCSVQVFRSSEASQLSASIGWVTLFGSVKEMYSTIWRADVGHLRPVVVRRVLHLLDFHGDAQDAALLGVRVVHERQLARGIGRRRQPGHGIGGARGEAGQRRDADELAPAQAAALHQIERLLGLRMETTFGIMRR